MKLKRIAAVLLSMSLTLSMAQAASAFDVTNNWESTTLIEEDYGTDQITPYTYAIEAPEPVEGSNQYDDDVMPLSTTTKTYKAQWTVPARGETDSPVKVYMTSGDTFTFNLTYTPTSANMEIGVMQPNGVFLRYTRSDGKLSSTLKVTQNGIYYIKVKNNSSSSVKFSGTYSFNANCPFEYMFKSPYMATFISSQYGELRSDGYHYALDITTGVTGEIENYPVYNTLTGTVIKNGKFLDNKTTCVAITHTNGYTSRFLHMDIYENGLVEETSISTGKQIGKVSNKGCDAIHLHLDVNTVGETIGSHLNGDNTVNPKLLFPDVSFT